MNNPFKTGDILQPIKYGGSELDESRTYTVERVTGAWLDLVGVKKKGLHSSQFRVVSNPKIPEPGFVWSPNDKDWVPLEGAKGLDGTEKPEDWRGLSTEKALLAEASEPTQKPVLMKGQAGGLKFDTGKDQWHLLLSAKGMLAGLQGVVRVLMFGAKKYAAHSWREVEDNERRYMDGLMRHYVAVLEHGLESVDHESGHLHIDHLNCNGLFLAELARKAKS